MYSYLHKTLASHPGPSDQDPSLLLPVAKASLSPARGRLLEIMQRLNFGRIEHLVIEDGEPVLAPLPRLVREAKFGGDNGPRPELGARNFLLKTQLVELFRYLDTTRDVTIELLEIKHGLPFKMEVAVASC
jgi:hypothetical protein